MARLLNATKTRATVNTPAVREAVNFYIGLINDGLAGTQQQLGAGWCGEALGKEKAAIIFEGNWVMPFMAEQFPSVNYRVNRMVRGKQPATLSFTVSYSIAKASKNKAAAWTLLTYLTGKQGMGTWTSKGLELPSRKDVKLRVPGRTAFIAGRRSRARLAVRARLLEGDDGREQRADRRDRREADGERHAGEGPGSRERSAPVESDD